MHARCGREQERDSPVTPTYSQKPFQFSSGNSKKWNRENKKKNSRVLACVWEEQRKARNADYRPGFSSNDTTKNAESGLG